MSSHRAGDAFGPFDLLEAIGSGATARVFHARRRADGLPVALKILDPSGASGRERFESEVAALRRVSHPSVVDVVAAGEQDGHLWLAMELVQGMPLDDWVSRVAGATRLRHILLAGVEVAGALAAVHDLGILHRDIKPANVLVQSTGRVKLVDFGFAGHVDRPEEGGLAGTLRYMSPERLSGAVTDLRSDLFSLGVVLFELLARRPPHIGKDRNLLILAQCTEPAPSVAEFAPEVPAPAVEIIDRLLAKAATARPRAAHEVVEALRLALAEDPRTARWRPVLLTGRFIGHRSLVKSIVGRCLAGETASILLYGPGGIGLSRLLQEIEGRVLVRGARPIAVQGGARPLFRVLEEMVGPQRPSEIRRALLAGDRDLLLAAWPELRRTSEDVISLSRPPTPADLSAAVRNVLRRAAAETPLLISIDDAELADARDLRLLQSAGLLLMASHNPDLIALEAERVSVPPLDRSQLATVAASMLGPAGPRMAWEHAERLAGRPGRLATMARALVGGDPPPLTGPDDTGPIAVKVRPWEFAVREAEAALADGSPDDALRVLDEASRGPPPSEIRYRAELIQARAALQSGRVSDARSHAQTAAEVADSPRQRSMAMLTEGLTALRTGDFGHLERIGAENARIARELGDTELTCRWDVLRARASLRGGGLTAAARLLAPHLGGDPSDNPVSVGVYWTAAEVAVHSCDWDRARDLLLAARQAGSDNAGRRVRAGLRAVVGQLWLRRGHIDKAIEQLVRAHQDLARTADSELLAQVRAHLAEARLLSGAVDEAGRLAATAIETANASDSRWVQPLVVRVALRHARVTADLSRLRELVLVARDLCEKHRSDPWAAPLAAQLGLGLHEIGDEEQGRRWLALASALAPEDPHDRLVVALSRLAVAARGGTLKPDHASRIIERAQQLGLDHMMRISLGFTMRWSGTAQHRQLGRLIRQARTAGDRYGACWLGVSAEQDSEALRQARSLGFLAMAEGRAMPA